VPSELGYIQNRLVRAGIEHDPDGLLAEATRPGMPVVAIAGEQAILNQNGGSPSAVLPGAIDAETPSERVLLGMLDGRPLAGLLYDAGLADRIAEAPSLFAQDLRSIAVQGLVPADELGMLAQAKSLLSWHARHRFCANCGSLDQSGDRRAQARLPVLFGPAFPPHGSGVDHAGRAGREVSARPPEALRRRLLFLPRRVHLAR
jgi:NAD+ diphosphatase